MCVEQFECGFNDSARVFDVIKQATRRGYADHLASGMETTVIAQNLPDARGEERDAVAHGAASTSM